MNLKKQKLLKKFYLCIAGVLVLVSCQSKPSRAYLPPLPRLEDKYSSLEREPVKYLETLLGNYKKALQWIVIVWESNEGERR